MPEALDAEDLLEAVSDVLKGTLASPPVPLSPYQTRIAVHVLGIVRRELSSGASLAQAQREGLLALLNAAGDGGVGEAGQGQSLEALNERLCLLLRSGAIGLETPGLLDHLWRTTLAKVAIDQPSYSTYRRVSSLKPGSH